MTIPKEQIMAIAARHAQYVDTKVISLHGDAIIDFANELMQAQIGRLVNQLAGELAKLRDEMKV